MVGDTYYCDCCWLLLLLLEHCWVAAESSGEESGEMEQRSSLGAGPPPLAIGPGSGTYGTYAGTHTTTGTRPVLFIGPRRVAYPNVRPPRRFFVQQPLQSSRAHYFVGTARLVQGQEGEACGCGLHDGLWDAGNRVPGVRICCVFASKLYRNISPTSNRISYSTTAGINALISINDAGYSKAHVLVDVADPDRIQAINWHAHAHALCRS